MLRRIPDWLIYAVLLVMLVHGAQRSQQDVVSPLPPPQLGPILSTQTPRDERIIVTVDKPRAGVGTAFAIDDDGRWMTARHVVDSCTDVGVKISSRKILRAEVEIIKEADLAILTSEWSRQPLPHDVNTDRRVGETGFFFGYPQGKPGEVVGALLGRSRMTVRGRYRSDEGVLAWSELARTRGLFGSLGGLSGSPVLDKDGEVIGVVSAESPRRGRIYTVAPKYLRRHLTEKSGGPEELSLDSYGLQADKLRRDRRVAQVICLVG